MLGSVIVRKNILTFSLHDHKTSLRAMNKETPVMNSQLILLFCSDYHLFNIFAVSKSKVEINIFKDIFGVHT